MTPQLLDVAELRVELKFVRMFRGLHANFFRNDKHLCRHSPVTVEAIELKRQ